VVDVLSAVSLLLIVHVYGVHRIYFGKKDWSLIDITNGCIVRIGEGPDDHGPSIERDVHIDSND